MVALLSLAVLSVGRSVSIELVAYHGWADCYRMSNGVVDLIYVPQIGRVMRFGRVGAPNLLWENSRLAGQTSESAKAGEWANYGGDKLWPAPQSLWNWPPDPILDGGPYKVSSDQRSLIVEGPSSPKSGVRFERRISMDAATSAIHFENWMTNTSDRPQELAVWQITQTDNPDAVIVPLEVTPQMPNGWAPYDGKPIAPGSALVTGGALTVRRDPKTGFKLGSASRKGVLIAEWATDQLTISVKKLPGKYVDGGKFLEVYSNANPDKYMELEITGPLTVLAPGEGATLKSEWRIGPR